MGMQERRRYERSQLSFELMFNEDGEVSAVDSLNLSASGILFKNPRPLEIGKVIIVKFTPPNSDRSYELDTEVVRWKEIKDEDYYEIAVNFLNLDNEDLERLNSDLVDRERK